MPKTGEEKQRDELQKEQANVAGAEASLDKKSRETGADDGDKREMEVKRKNEVSKEEVGRTPEEIAAAGSKIAANDLTREGLIEKQKARRKQEIRDRYESASDEEKGELRTLRKHAGLAEEPGEGGDDDGSEDSDGGAEFDTDEQMVTIKVYGKEEQAPLTDILKAADEALGDQAGEASNREKIEAGIRAVQIARAEEVKASRKKPAGSSEEPTGDEGEGLNARLARIEAALSAGQRPESLPTNTAKDSATPPPPATGADEAQLRRYLVEASNHLYQGEQDAFVEKMLQLNKTTGAATPATLTDDVIDRIADRASERAVQHGQRDAQVRASQAFMDEFPDIAGTPSRMAYAKARLQEVRGDPEHRDASPLELVRMVGREANKAFGVKADSQVDDLANKLNRRRELKRSMPTSTGGAAGRAPAPPAKQSKTRSQIVKDMAAARNQKM